MNSITINILSQGGPLMWPLVLLSLLGLAIFIERVLFLHRGNIRSGEFLSGIKNLLRKRRLIEALTVCEETQSPIAMIVKSALIHHSEPEGKVRSAIQSTALAEIPVMERRTGTLGMIAKIAPMICLLGTLIALFQAYLKMESIGAYVNSPELTGYIAQALLTTLFGIAIAIIAYIAHHFLIGRITAIVNNMEWVANDIVQFLLYDLPDEEQTAPISLEKDSSMT